MSEKDPTTFWIKFFNDAGLPTTEAANHAVTFVQNRISQDMMLDLTKEYLNDMGITMMGDVIAILRHAKEAVAQNSKSKLLKGVLINPVTGAPMRSTAVSRTVAHYLFNGEDRDSPKPISLDLATRLGTKESHVRSGSAPSLVRLGELVRSTKDSVPVPSSRRVLPEQEGKYKVIMPKGTTPRSRRLLATQKKARTTTGRLSGGEPGSVFSRLGPVAGSSESANSSPEPGSVFSRLGGAAVKRPATSTVPDSDSDDARAWSDGELEYHGVLKMSPAKKRALDTKSITRTVSVVSSATTAAQASSSTLAKAPRVADPESASDEEEEVEEMMDDDDGALPSTEGIFSPFSVHSKKSVSERLGKPVIAEAQSSTVVSTQAKGKAPAKVNLTAKTAPKKGIQFHLGPPPGADSSPAAEDSKPKVSARVAPKSSAAPTKQGVLSRLGPAPSTPATAAATPSGAKTVKTAPQKGTGVFSRLGKQR